MRRRASPASAQPSPSPETLHARNPLPEVSGPPETSGSACVRRAAMDRQGRLLALAIVALSAAWFVGVLALTRDGPLPPDAAAYGVIARNLARGDGYTESFVPFHPGPYDSIRHLPDLHGLLTPALVAPLFALQGGASATAIRLPAALAAPGIALV